MKSMIYVDNAATTQISDTVLEAMLPYLKENYGNASSIYRLGRMNHQAIEKSRQTIATCIHALPSEIYFTSGGTEADNWALRGIMKEACKQGKNHLIISSIEHHAIIHTAKVLQEEGIQVTYLPVNAKGRVDLEQLKEAITSKTALVSIMYANNEIGTIQDIEAIAQMCHERQVLFHSDAVQAIGTLPVDVKKEKIDLLSSSAHKYHGPKGIGFLYIRKGIKIAPLMEGGAQEKGYRPGTENVASIVGMATALKNATAMLDEKNKQLSKMRDDIEKGLLEIPGSHLNGDIDHRLPGISNISFENIDGESLLFELDLKGIAASAGSACASGSIDPSHVLLALGIPYQLAHGSLRISLGIYNQEEEVEKIITAIKEAVDYTRTR